MISLIRILTSTIDSFPADDEVRLLLALREANKSTENAVYGVENALSSTGKGRSAF